MRMARWMRAAARCAAALVAWTAAGSSAAEAGDAAALPPEADGYEVVYRLDPLQWKAQGYTLDRSKELGDEPDRAAYWLRVVGEDDAASWVFVSMDAFSDEAADFGVPKPGGPVFQKNVANLEVAGDAPGLKTGRFERGNIEIWGDNYGPANARAVPGAVDDAFDFGDEHTPGGSFGTMQIHNTAEKQTVLAFNNLQSGAGCDLGAGPNTTGEGFPDWTFSGSGKKLKSAELVILARFRNRTGRVIVTPDPEKTRLSASTDRNPVEYGPGDEMRFTFAVDFGGVVPTRPHAIRWTRTGDDGKTERGETKIAPGEPAVVATRLDAPGFVHLVADLVDDRGRLVNRKGPQGEDVPIRFDGGAGVRPEKLEAGAPEPADFDAFWARQRARLAEVPPKAAVERLPSSNDTVEVFAVKVDCAGPRPVTGYLTVPVGAAAKSLPAAVSFWGHGVYQHYPLPPTDTERIRLDINAHGHEVGREPAYYDAFRDSIQPDGQPYGFHAETNADPERAYFNGMALRVMRAMEFVKAQPAWDGKNLEAWGGSQGGLQVMWAAGLDPDVSLAKPYIPWCCDLGGGEAGRLRGWAPPWRTSLDYYDPVHHARRVKGTTHITRAGLGDYVCPPSGVAVLFNNLPTPKRVVWVQDSTHGYIAAEPEEYIVDKP